MRISYCTLVLQAIHEENRVVPGGCWNILGTVRHGADRTEMHDLVEPQRVKELAALWDAWAVRAHVLPLGTWRADKKKGCALTGRVRWPPAGRRCRPLRPSADRAPKVRT